MVTEKMIEAAADAMSRQDITFANCDRSWQKRTIRAALEAALSTDAEPVKPICNLVWKQYLRAADDVEDYFEVARPGDKCVDGSDPFPVYAAPPAHPAPSVAVKALRDAYQKYLDASKLYNERLAISKTKEFGTMQVHEEYRAIDVARRAFDKLAVDVATSALSEQVQDVAEEVREAAAEVISAHESGMLRQTSWWQNAAFLLAQYAMKTGDYAAPAAKQEGKP